MSPFDRLKSTERYDVLWKPGDDSKHWHEVRKTGIGASESAAILGLGYGSAAAVYASKIGLDEPSSPDSANLWFGRILEEPILEFFKMETGLAVERWECVLKSRDSTWMNCTPDGLVSGDGSELVEIKAVGSYRRQHNWRKYGVPPEVWTQVQHQMFVTGATSTYVVALLTSFDVFWTKVQRDDEFIYESLLPETGAFWKCVTEHLPVPDDKITASESTKRALGRIYPKSNETAIELPAYVAAQFDRRVAIQEEIGLLTTEKDLLDNVFRNLLGSNSTGSLPDGRKVSWKTQQRTRYDVPDKIKSKYKSTSEFRVIRYKDKNRSV